MEKVKQSAAWAALIVAMLLLLVIVVTGRFAIFLSIVLVPDNVGVNS